MGYEIELFSDVKIADAFKCPICHQVLQDVAMTDPCEHVFCRLCIQRRFLRHGKRCSVDDKVVSGLKTPQRVYMNLLNALKLRCPHSRQGCQMILELGLVENHIRNCRFNKDNFKTCEKDCRGLIFLPEAHGHNCAEILKGEVLKLKRDVAEEKTKQCHLNSKAQGLEEQTAAKGMEAENLRHQISQLEAEIVTLNRKLESEKVNRKRRLV